MQIVNGVLTAFGLHSHWKALAAVRGGGRGGGGRHHAEVVGGELPPRLEPDHLDHPLPRRPHILRVRQEALPVWSDQFGLLT